MNRMIVLLAAAACSASDSGELVVQTIRGDAVACRGCAIVLDSIAYLPHPDDSVAVEPWSRVERNSRGQFFVIEGSARRSVVFFDSSGRVAGTFGKPGTGPGEFSRLSEVKVGRGDSLFVFDSKWVHVFSPSFEYARHYPLAALARPYPGQSVVLRDGRMVLPTSANRIALLNVDGTLDSASRAGVEGPWQPAALRAIGIWLQGSDTVRCLDCGRRYVGLANDGDAIWSGAMNIFVIQKHDLSGRLLQQITRDVDWFPPWHSDMPAGNSAAVREYFMRPRLVGAAQNPDGLIIVLVHRASRANPFPPEFDFLGSSPGKVSAIDLHHETVVEVLDPASVKLLASVRLQGEAVLLNDGLIAQFVPDSVNARATKILRLRIQRP
jgi:hypothetical protein